MNPVRDEKKAGFGSIFERTSIYIQSRRPMVSINFSYHERDEF